MERKEWNRMGGMYEDNMSVCSPVQRFAMSKLKRRLQGRCLSRPLGLRIDPGKREDARGLVKRGLQGRCLAAGGGAFRMSVKEEGLATRTGTCIAAGERRQGVTP